MQFEVYNTTSLLVVVAVVAVVVGKRVAYLVAQEEDRAEEESFSKPKMCNEESTIMKTEMSVKGRSKGEAISFKVG